MLTRFIKHQEALTRFFYYINRHPAGRAEFKGAKLRSLTVEDWAAIKCLQILLFPFALTTEEIEGSRLPR
jgi:hypothetical protein